MSSCSVWRNRQRRAASIWRGAALRVLGIERFAPGHDRGSSHGVTRIIRLGYFEHPSYVPLVRRAYALWRELEAAAGGPLLTSPASEIGPPDGALVAGTLRVVAPARPAARGARRARADAAFPASESPPITSA